MKFLMTFLVVDDLDPEINISLIMVTKGINDKFSYLVSLITKDLVARLTINLSRKAYQQLKGTT